MDTDWFREPIQRTGGVQADLVRHLGLAPSAVSRMQEAVETAQFLGVPQDEVLRRAGSAAPTLREPRHRGRPRQPKTPLLQPTRSQDQIPIRD